MAKWLRCCRCDFDLYMVEIGRRRPLEDRGNSEMMDNKFGEYPSVGRVPSITLGTFVCNDCNDCNAVCIQA